MTPSERAAIFNAMFEDEANRRTETSVSKLVAAKRQRKYDFICSMVYRKNERPVIDISIIFHTFPQLPRGIRKVDWFFIITRVYNLQIIAGAFNSEIIYKSEKDIGQLMVEDGLKIVDIQYVLNDVEDTEVETVYEKGRDADDGEYDDDEDVDEGDHDYDALSDVAAERKFKNHMLDVLQKNKSMANGCYRIGADVAHFYEYNLSHNAQFSDVLHYDGGENPFVAHERLQQQSVCKQALIMIVHANYCKHDECPHFFCGYFKRVQVHTNACLDDACERLFCTLYKKLIIHFNECDEHQCSLCTDIKVQLKLR